MAEGNGSSDHVKWVIRVVSAGIIGISAYLLKEDRDSINRRLTAVEALTFLVQREQEAHQRESDAHWQEVQRSLNRIESRQAAIRAKLNE